MGGEIDASAADAATPAAPELQVPTTTDGTAVGRVDVRSPEGDLLSKSPSAASAGSSIEKRNPAEQQQLSMAVVSMRSDGGVNGGGGGGNVVRRTASSGNRRRTNEKEKATGSQSVGRLGSKASGSSSRSMDQRVKHVLSDGGARLKFLDSGASDSKEDVAADNAQLQEVVQAEADRLLREMQRGQPRESGRSSVSAISGGGDGGEAGGEARSAARRLGSRGSHGVVLDNVVPKAEGARKFGSRGSHGALDLGGKEPPTLRRGKTSGMGGNAGSSFGLGDMSHRRASAQRARGSIAARGSLRLSNLERGSGFGTGAPRRSLQGAGRLSVTAGAAATGSALMGHDPSGHWRTQLKGEMRVAVEALRQMNDAHAEEVRERFDGLEISMLQVEETLREAAAMAAMRVPPSPPVPAPPVPAPRDAPASQPPPPSQAAPPLPGMQTDASDSVLLSLGVGGGAGDDDLQRLVGGPATSSLPPNGATALQPGGDSMSLLEAWVSSSPVDTGDQAPLLDDGGAAEDALFK